VNRRPNLRDARTISARSLSYHRVGCSPRYPTPVRRRHAGAFRSRHPLPCGKRSKWTKTVGGRVRLRLTASEKHRRALEARAIMPEEE